MTNVELLLRVIDEAFEKKSWHGTNLRGSIRGMSAAEAAWRPAKDRRNIHELVLHAAYWKYTVRRRLLGEKRGSFPLEGSNWFERPLDGRVDEARWKEDVAILVATHRSLREAVAALDDATLTKPASGGATSILSLLTGIAAHDLHHTGQIQMLKRLHGEARS